MTMNMMNHDGMNLNAAIKRVSTCVALGTAPFVISPNIKLSLLKSRLDGAVIHNLIA